MNEEYTAWMIREDGTAIPCVQHIYGNPDCIEETLYAAEWLYRNTQNEETKNLVFRFLSAYADFLNPDEDPVRNLLDHIADQPYVTLTKDFIQAIGGALFHSEEDLQELNRLVCTELNTEFLRARLGGRYNTEQENRDLYIRVSTEKYNWIKTVKGFLSAHRDLIETVSVVYDEESMGKGDFLCDVNGNVMDHLSLEFFGL